MHFSSLSFPVSACKPWEISQISQNASLVPCFWGMFHEKSKKKAKNKRGHRIPVQVDSSSAAIKSPRILRSPRYHLHEVSATFPDIFICKQHALGKESRARGLLYVHWAATEQKRDPAQRAGSRHQVEKEMLAGLAWQYWYLQDLLLICRKGITFAFLLITFSISYR